MPSLRSARIIRYPLVIALSLWIAGAGCILGCEGMVVTAATSQDAAKDQSDLGMIVSGEACASSKSHDCCASRRAKHNAKPVRTDTTGSALAGTSQSSNGMQDCPLAANRGGMATSSRRNEAPAVVNTELPVTAAQTFSEITHPVTAKTQLPNRGHTYLRCCVFLI